jgi:nicastrin
MKTFLAAFVTVLSCVLATFDGDQFDGELEYVVSNDPCVRLFSNQGDMGCRTTSSQSLGALYELVNSADILELSSVDVDFAVLAPSQLFNSELLTALEGISKAKGVIIYDSDGWVPSEDSGLYSPDVQTPQGEGTFQADFTLGNTVQWNNYGNGEMYSSFEFPVVRVSAEEDIQRLKLMCSDNRKYGLTSNRVNVAEFQYYMGQQGMTSLQCLDWKDIYGNKSPQCMPVGGTSVWATAGVLDNRKKIVITAGIDSTAFFHDLAFGANDAAASIAVVLAAAEAVGRSLPSTFTSQPLFFLSNAEEWGYAGSRRFVRDITSGISCAAAVDAPESSSGLPLCTDPIYPSTLFANLTANSISDVVAIDQVGNLLNGNLYVHSLYDDSPTVETMVGIDYGVDGYGVSTSSAAGSIPPTPLTSFLSGLGGTLGKKGVVLSGYDAVFNDPKYHSNYDASNSSVSTDDVIAAATILAKTVVSLSGGDVASVAEVNTAWTSSVLECLLSDWSCPMMQNYVSAEKSNIEYAVHGSVSIDKGTVPPNYYAGTLNAVNGGLPVVQHEQYIYGKYDGDWNSDRDRAFIIPNALEAFIRSSLSYHLFAESLGQGDSTTCETSADCGNCTILDYDAVRMECLLYSCVCPTASYHLAVDPGLESDVYPNQFVVLDEDTPCYTEPFWRNIGLRVYPQASTSILVVAVVVGVTAVVVRFVAVFI